MRYWPDLLFGPLLEVSSSSLDGMSRPGKVDGYDVVPADELGLEDL